MRPDPSPHADTWSEDVNDRITMLIWASLFLALAVFSKLPGLDLLVSARYWHPDKGFVHAQDAFVVGMYTVTPWLGRTLLLLLALFALTAPAIARLLKHRGHFDLATRCTGSWRHLAAVAALAAALGNGLIVEGVLKNTMGRPRPVQTQEFGGPVPYVAPFHLGAHPGEHRSFTSGHAATGFSLMCLGLTCSPLWRRRWLLIGMVVGAVVGFGRILQGGHYLSDVLFSFYAIWLSCELVVWWDHRRQRRRAAAAGTAPPTP
ncbi:phosphatase PAP2 family protein [uncultured Aquabacterium sp.]|uniref:phosphatase PAP2 family protein n=1 Tax=Aquabacterium sp. TaxID=1872578 RepID=UPI0025CFFA8D|nr:phosphatase PAP2 family protein [uncultured Aquabacterium sp.]